MNALPGPFAEDRALAGAAVATLAAFRAARDAGALDPRQHAALLSLEEAVQPITIAAAESAELTRRTAEEG